MSSPIFDAIAPQFDIGFNDPVTWSHTCTGTNLVLYVFVSPSFSNTPVPTGVTYNGVAMTALPSSPTTGDLQGDKLWGWYMINPPTGAHTVSVSMSPQSQYLTAFSISYTNQDQVTPFGSAFQNQHEAAGGANTTNTVAITSASGELGLFVASHDFYDNTFTVQPTTTATVGGSATQRGQVTNTQSSTDGQSTRLMIADVAGAATVNPSFALSKDVFWWNYGISLKGPSGASAPTVTTSAATSVAATTATGNGNVTADGGSTVTERGVVWGLSANPTTSGNKATTSGTTGTYSVGITGLTPGVTYHYRAYAINAVGTSYGSDTTFTTTGPANFNDARQLIINGLTSAQSEANGWNADVKPAIPVGNVVRTSSTLATITLPAVAAYDITVNEFVTANVPGSSLTSNTNRTASPTFQISPTGGGGVTTVFADNFESGDFSHTQNGVSWTSTVYVDNSSSISHGGTKCARFREGDSGNWSELRFGGLANLPEIYVQYYLYMPDGTEGIGPKAKIIGTLNDKAARFWGGGDEGYDFGNTYVDSHGVAQPYGNKVGGSTWGDGSAVNGYIGAEFEYSDPTGGATGQWNMGETYGDGVNNTGSPTHVQFIDDANRGRWLQIRWHIKQASPANNDGVIEYFLDGATVFSYTHLQNGNIYAGTNSPFGFTTGYILGAANNGWPTGQYVYLDDFSIKTGGF